jgi:hypothetical protein
MAVCTRLRKRATYKLYMIRADYSPKIRMPSDLKALCLTSKALRALTTPLLYDRIYLRIWDDHENKSFFGSMRAGGDVHLSNTRTLVIEDEPAPQESNAVDLFANDSFSRPYPISSEDRDRTFELVMQMLPKDELRSFR